jgi:hypothetical protein
MEDFFDLDINNEILAYFDRYLIGITHIQIAFNYDIY